ncbi:lytic transglycosylase domain-containing protein [Sphingobium estronivorans]|uniref:lytic transglycosylase domain-containing protein n=1 Tax=Sphingobium estronivorans TaxID=1577690 RepID=UPI00123BB6AF|nr:lytic transglycosylase domain-containing protein [Sphingobium estronivorans]
MIIDSRFIRRLLAIVLLIAPPEFAGAHAASSASHETRIASCIRQVSGGRTWLEKTLWGLRDKEGGWVGAEVPNSDGSHDLGPLQINSWWVTRIADKVQRPPNIVRYWLVNDACFNVDAARWIFLSALTTTGDYWKAIGVYHSPTAWRQRRYAALVAVKMSKRFGTAIFSQRRSRETD